MQVRAQRSWGALGNVAQVRALLLLVCTSVAGCSVHAQSSPVKRKPSAAASTLSSGDPQPTAAATKPTKEELKHKLGAEQFRVTQQCGTEAPFHNAYWDNHAPGIYVDVVSGEALFSSLDKYDSGTGWPSFKQPLEAQNVVERSDQALGMTRTEVRSKHADSHLGHVFDDGPGPTGQRYCMNSAALRFIPADKLVEAGYGQYAKLFAGVKQSMAQTQTTPSEPSTSSEVAVLAGGCFWGMENILRKIPGVQQTEVGYTGGGSPNPSYEDVSTGTTGHAEAVQITFDPHKLSYETLLGYFFRMHDPTTKDRQENDVGTQYRSAIFYTSQEQLKVAEAVKERAGRSGKWKHPIVTQIVAATTFFPAEQYHQDYLMKHPGGYSCHYLRD